MVPRGAPYDGSGVASPPARGARAATLRAWLPEGRALAELDAAWRHKVVLLVVAAHLPVLVLVGPLTGHSWPHTFVDLVPVLFLKDLTGIAVLLSCAFFMIELAIGPIWAVAIRPPAATATNRK